MLEHVKQGSVLLGHITGGKNLEIFEQSVNRFLDVDRTNLKLVDSRGSATGTFHEQNRNGLVNLAMSKPNIEWLVQTDTDMEFKPEDIYSLLYMADAVEHRIISALCFSRLSFGGLPIKIWPVWFNLDKKNEFIVVSALDGDPLQRIDAAGAGMCLIHMSVFREFPEVDHDWRWYARDPWVVDNKIEHLGEDLSFMLRLNRLCMPGYERWSNLPPKKIPIWGHRGVSPKHWKEVPIGVEEYLAQGIATLKSEGPSKSKLHLVDGAEPKPNIRLIKP